MKLFLTDCTTVFDYTRDTSMCITLVRLNALDSCSPGDYRTHCVVSQDTQVPQVPWGGCTGDGNGDGSKTSGTKMNNKTFSSETLGERVKEVVSKVS
jgi:hypothetical protein